MNLPHFNNHPTNKYEFNKFDGLRNIFSVKLQDMYGHIVQLLEENLRSISIFENHVIIRVPEITEITPDDTRYKLNKETVAELFANKPTIIFTEFDRDGSFVSDRLFKKCSIVDISELTYDYGCNMDDVIDLYIIIKFKK